MMMSVFYILSFMLMGLLSSLTWGMMGVMLIVLGLKLVSEFSFEYIDFHVMSFYFCVDLISGLMLLLSVYISLMMVFSSVNLCKGPYGQVFMGLLVLMMLFMLVIFSSSHLLVFYLAFEGILIPTYLLILGWGYQPERMKAGVYLLFYTLFTSIPFLVMVLWIQEVTGSLMWILEKGLINTGGLMVCLGGFVAFFVKVPMYMLHLWLPSAHVEAPVSGSMILAGVLLSMGGYGVIRFMLMYCGDISYFEDFIIILSLVGCVSLGLVCLRQSDLKSLIAYSSVVHMGLMLSGIFSGGEIGLSGGVLLMMGHGLCSSGLFFLVNMIYMKTGSRSLVINKGTLLFIPSMGLMWFLMISSNISAPPSLSLFGEVSVLSSLMKWNYLVFMLLVCVLFVSGAYSLFVFSNVVYNKSGYLLLGFMEPKLFENLVVLLHWLLLNGLFLSVNL